MGRQSRGRGQHLFYRIARFASLIIGVWLFGSGTALTPIQAQDAYAAWLEVRYAGVEVMLSGTTAWLPLPQDAISPLGAGDQVRTLENGRALITFADTSTIILLNESQLAINTYTQDMAGKWDFAASLESGVLVQTIPNPNDFIHYALRVDELTLTTAVPSLAAWAEAEAPDTIIIGEGEAMILRDDESFTVAANTGLRSSEDAPTPMTPPLMSAARLEAELIGCVGVIKTVQRTGLFVRVTPSQVFEAVDLLPDDLTVPVVGVTQSGEWSRIQYLSGFAWMFTIALESDCTANLQRYPNDSERERLTRAFNASESEVLAFTPYFGRPPENPVFYQRK